MVVIGSGVGGLTAAALLAKTGLKTVVFEADNQIGGYMAGFTRKGFHFDSSIHWLNQCAPGELAHNLWSQLDADVPTCPTLKNIHRYKSDNYDYLLTSNPLELRDNFIKDFPDDEVGIRRFFDDARQLGRRLFAIGKLHTRKVEGVFGKLLRNLKMAYYGIGIIKYVRTPTIVGLNKYFKSPKLISVFSTRESMISVMVPFCWAFDKSFQMPPKGGCRTIASWLCDRLESFGGKIFLGKRVAKIIVDGNAATGIRLENGEEIDADYVIAACDVLQLYSKLLPKNTATPNFMKSMDDAILYTSNFSICLGLDCDPVALGFGEEVLNLIVPSLEHDDRRESVIMIIAPSVRDESAAPSGKGTLTIHCPIGMDYCNYWHTDNGFKRGNAYYELKTKFTDKLMSCVENSMHLNLRDHVEVMEVATPITYWRYTANDKGSTMGTKPCRHNIKAKISSYKTPIENVWVGGHGADYGGGVPMAAAAGANACLAILKEVNQVEFDKLCAVMDFDVKAITILPTQMKP